MAATFASVASVRLQHWSTIVATAMVLTGCARPGGTTDEARGSVTAGSDATAVASAGRFAVTPAPPRSGEASCAWGARPMPSVDLSASFDVNDPEQRARRVLAEQYRPLPRRGALAEAAVPGAEACVHALKREFSLRAGGSRAVPDEPAIGAALRSAGLTNIDVRPGPAFTASTGAACIYGTFTASGPGFTLGPPATDGSCPP